MTMKFTTSRIKNRISPITTSPPIRKPPKAATTWPAASGPSLPCDRISRVVATLSDRRSNVVSSSSVGKEEKSSGRLRNSDTISTRTAAVIDIDRPKSNSSGGSGSTRTESSATTPSASPMSLPGENCRSRAVNPGRNPTAMAASAMGQAPPPSWRAKARHPRLSRRRAESRGWRAFARHDGKVDAPAIRRCSSGSSAPHAAATPAVGGGTATPCAA